MSWRRRRRKRWSIQDFDSYISRKVGNGYLELKRLLLGAPHLVKVLRGKGRWIHPARLDPGESVVGFFPASAKPLAEESLFDSYRTMLAEAESRPKPEPVLPPPPRRPPVRRPWRSLDRGAA